MHNHGEFDCCSHGVLKEYYTPRKQRYSVTLTAAKDVHFAVRVEAETIGEAVLEATKKLQAEGFQTHNLTYFNCTPLP